MSLTAFGKQVRKLRIDAGMTLKDMADRLGGTSAYYSAIETGKKNVPPNLVARLGELFGLDMVGRNQLEELATQSASDLKLSMSGFNNSQREVAAAFARQFTSLDENDLEAFRKLLNKKL